MEDNKGVNVDVQNQENNDVQQEQKTYSQEEFDKALQSEVDKRVTQAMQTAQKKADARVKEAEKLAKMNEQQRYEYELDSREKAIAEKERALALAENKAQAASVLADKGISAKLVDFVVAEDAETMMNNMTAYVTAVNGAIDLYSDEETEENGEGEEGYDFKFKTPEGNVITEGEVDENNNVVNSGEYTEAGKDLLEFEGEDAEAYKPYTDAASDEFAKDVGAHAERYFFASISMTLRFFRSFTRTSKRPSPLSRLEVTE